MKIGPGCSLRSVNTYSHHLVFEKSRPLTLARVRPTIRKCLGRAPCIRGPSTTPPVCAPKRRLAFSRLKILHFLPGRRIVACVQRAVSDHTRPMHSEDRDRCRAFPEYSAASAPYLGHIQAYDRFRNNRSMAGLVRTWRVMPAR